MGKFDRVSFLWFDLETTGLDEKSDQVIEVGYIITNRYLQEIESGEAMFHLPKWMQPNEEVVQLHAKSGILDRARATPEDQTFKLFQENLLAKLKTYNGPFVLAGSSVHFDRKFIDNPYLDKLLLHRHLDTSTVKMLFQIFRPGLELPPQFLGEPAHRALLDARYSLDLMRHYVTLLKDVGGKDEHG